MNAVQDKPLGVVRVDLDPVIQLNGGDETFKPCDKTPLRGGGGAARGLR